MKRSMSRAVAIAALVPALWFAGCGDDDADIADGGPDAADTKPDSDTDDETTTSAAAAAPAGDSQAVTIKGFAYSALSAPGGSKIKVSNQDTAKHTYTAKDKSFTVEVDGGGEAELTLPAKPGSYDIICEIHPSMSGKATIT